MNCDELLVLALEARDGAIRLPGSSHAEAALASRVDVHVSDDIRVVKSLVKRRRNGVGCSRGGLGKGGLLMRDGCLVETCGGAEGGEEGEDREGETSHGVSVSFDRM
mmetsp:Transcript_444/g.984  ORF Transcript_444/g.984 Transcript_444/m.984 type:complete len:107 (+) Transcript_444:593-913(+)